MIRQLHCLLLLCLLNRFFELLSEVACELFRRIGVNAVKQSVRQVIYVMTGGNNLSYSAILLVHSSSESFGVPVVRDYKLVVYKSA